MHPTHAIPRRALALALATLVAACAATRPEAPRIPPAVSLRLEHFAGTPLRGARDADDALRPDRPAEDASSIEFRVLYLDAEPATELPRLATHTRMVVAADGDEPIRPVAELASHARIATGEDAQRFRRQLDAGAFGRARELARLRGALLPETTAVLRATSHATVTLPSGETARRDLALFVSRGPEAEGASAGDGELYDVALAIESVRADPRTDEPGGRGDGPGGSPGAARAASDGSAEAVPPPAEAPLRREYALLADRLEAGGAALALLVPSPFDGDSGAAFAALVRVGPPPRRGEARRAHRAAFERSLRDMAAAAEEARAQASSLDASAILRREVTSALEALQLARLHRPALVFMATEARARLAADLALVADETTLARYASAVRERAEARLATADAGALGWLLEASAMSVLAEQADEGALAPELTGILLRHTGEAGRFPDVLLGVAEGAGGLAALYARLLAENRVFLEDSSPAARVRAHAWLEERGAAPEGFDPLADSGERRAALRRAEDAERADAAARGEDAEGP